MAKTKKTINILLFILLVLFPFGQLPRFSVFSGSILVTINFIDFVSAMFLIYFIAGFKRYISNNNRLVFLSVIVILLFSFVFSFTQFEFSRAIWGGLYLVRLLSYIAVFFVLKSKAKDLNKGNLIINSLVIISLSIAALGWFQYFIYPDLTSLYFLGWDDHLFRLVGTFLDPGFTSILLVLGFLLVFDRYYRKKNVNYLIICVILLITILFTYSRAGYLALLVASFTYLLIVRKLKIIAIFSVIFLISILLLPRPGGAGVRLERVFSVYSRIENYKETLNLWKHSPVFGFGYNNICLARQKYILGSDPYSHACSGSDSSILLVLSTTGMVGFLVFSNFLIKLFSEINKSKHKALLLSSLASVLVNSLFINSMFYSWIMAWFAILFSVYLTNTSNEE